MKFLLWIWEFPQNLIGFLMTRKPDFTIERKFKGEWVRVYYTHNVFGAGVCLGEYIILDYTRYCGLSRAGIAVDHECGHRTQSRIFGWLYLLVIGLPSVIRNIWDRLFHRKWTSERRSGWYYNGYPEKWADKIGGVVR